MARHISLSGGRAFAVVDDTDYDRLASHRWWVARQPNAAYAIRAEKIGVGLYRTVYMHREILRAPDGVQVDHINHDGLDNRRANLRLCSQSQNNLNRSRRRTGSPYRGVFYRADRGTWRAVIWVDGVRRYLGAFATAEEAALARDHAAKEHHGTFAQLNFPAE